MVCFAFGFEKCHFLPGGAPENWGDQVLFLRSKGGSLTFFKEIKYFVKHFRFQRKGLSDVNRG